MRHTITWGVEVLLVCGIIAAGRSLAASPDGGLPGRAKQSTTSIEPVVTPVTGSSWLHHLGIRSGDTGIGRGSGRYGPGASEPAAHQPLLLPEGRSVEVTGADLYRLNCQACHGAEGTGTPPDVRSVLPLVQGSSFQFMQQQLQLEGRTGAHAADARKQADQAKRDLYTRIKHGGQKMPPLAHLADFDIDMLYAYLTELAGTPDAQPLTRKTMSWDRLGENLVKGTCHICHDAVGRRPTGAELLSGAIPPLAILIVDKPVVDFVNKVRSGAPTTMGDVPFHYRGRMPVFYYLKEYEVAAAYLFLTNFPPR
jgi:Cytochrome C oxidase, cbb3-type, subunit III